MAEISLRLQDDQGLLNWETEMQTLIANSLGVLPSRINIIPIGAFSVVLSLCFFMLRAQAKDSMATASRSRSKSCLI